MLFFLIKKELLFIILLSSIVFVSNSGDSSSLVSNLFLALILAMLDFTRHSVLKEVFDGKNLLLL